MSITSASCAGAGGGTSVSPPRDAMEILGRSRIAVTLEIYTAADDTSRREAISKLNGLFGPGGA